MVNEHPYASSTSSGLCIPTAMLLSSITLNEQIQKTMNDFQTKMPQLFINTLLLIRETTGAYILMNTLSTNSVVDYSSQIINGYAMHNIPSSYNGCSCA